MEKKKFYHCIKFSARVLRQAFDVGAKLSPEAFYSTFSTQIGDEEWTLDNVDEFLNQYARDDIDGANLHITRRLANGSDIRLRVYLRNPRGTEVSVLSGERSFIDTTFSKFEEAPPEDKMKLENRLLKPVVFIGHGRHGAWEKLRNHLQDKHEIDVRAYETGARAGHTIRDILDNLSEESSLALLVLTGEDRTLEGVRARQNVIHECGLFQGKLGFERAIMLVERGVELASNFDGIQQLRFRKGRISEVFGDVLATLRREFGPF